MLTQEQRRLIYEAVEQLGQFTTKPEAADLEGVIQDICRAYETMPGARPLEVMLLDVLESLSFDKRRTQ